MYVLHSSLKLLCSFLSLSCVFLRLFASCDTRQYVYNFFQKLHGKPEFVAASKCNTMHHGCLFPPAHANAPRYSPTLQVLQLVAL